jgi:hypothetical protein
MICQSVCHRQKDSSASKVTGYILHSQGSVPCWDRNLFRLAIGPTKSHEMCIGGSVCGKRPEHKTGGLFRCITEMIYIHPHPPYVRFHGTW